MKKYGNTLHFLQIFFPKNRKECGFVFMQEKLIFKNGEMIMEYSSSMKKIGLILYGRAVLYCCDSEGNQDMIDELKKDAVFGERFPASDRFPALLRLCRQRRPKVMFIDYEHVIKRCEQACASSQPDGQQPSAADCCSVADSRRSGSICYQGRVRERRFCLI